ncbi:aldolase [Xylariaceae sp. FL0662B]|nr:aldolase [Xylariaceae sp. FL0662B]
MSSRKPPPSGVWCPAVTFFDPGTDTLVPEAQAKYYAYLSKTGLAGLVILGTNAETFLLTPCPSLPLMAGVGGHSTRQVLEHIQDAAEAGANYALVLPPAYFGKASTPEVIDNFYIDVANKSALPLVLYNFPGVCNGVDLDSTTIARLAKHDNIIGVKLTCGSVAKITRLAAELPPERFAVFGGQSDFLIGGLNVGSAGCIAAFANIFPKTIVQIYRLYKTGKFEEALALHQKAALAEQPCKSGIATTKYAVAIYSAEAAGIENAANLLKPRHPYLKPSEAAKNAVVQQMTEVSGIEQNLA